MHEEAVAAYRKGMILWGADTDEVAELEQAYASSGIRGFWQWHLQTLQDRLTRAYVEPTAFAKAYAAVGDSDRAFDWLAKAIEARDSELVFLRVEPDMDNLRSDPRFQDLLRRVGLPPD
jgi:hypothetical protein